MTTGATARRIRVRRWVIGSVVALVALIAAIWLLLHDDGGGTPEAKRILIAQSDLPFEVMIPIHLPDGFIRDQMLIDVTQLGPSGQPMVQLTYPNETGQALYLRQWIPIDPDKEILAASVSVETVWGRGWLRTQGQQLIALWTDIDGLRISTFANSQEVVSEEEMFQIVSSLSPVSRAVETEASD